MTAIGNRKSALIRVTGVEFTNCGILWCVLFKYEYNYPGTSWYNVKSGLYVISKTNIYPVSAYSPGN